MNLRHQIALNTHLKPGSPVSVPIGRRKTQQQLHFQQIIFGRNISASLMLGKTRSQWLKRDHTSAVNAVIALLTIATDVTSQCLSDTR